MTPEPKLSYKEQSQKITMLEEKIRLLEQKKTLIACKENPEDGPRPLEKGTKGKKAFQIFLAILNNSSIIRSDHDLYTVTNREVVVSERARQIIKSSVLMSKEFSSHFNKASE